MLKTLQTHHRSVIQMKFSGFSNIEIAEKTGMTPENVSLITRSALGKAYLEGLNDRAKEATLDVRKKLVSLNEGALKTFERLIDPKTKAPHAVQYNTAKDILDRNGYKAPDKYVIDMTLSTKTDEEIDAEINALEASITRVNNIKTLNSESIKISNKQETLNIPITQVVETITTSSEKEVFDYNFYQPEDEEATNLINSLPENILTSFDKQ